MSTYPDEEQVIAQTRHWLEQLVLKHNLCPFAHKPYQAGLVRFAVSAATRPGLLLADLDRELRHLQATPATELETTLLIHPAVLGDFYAYNDFLDTVDDLLAAQGLEGIFQVASFHPVYQFSGTEPDDTENYTNRSPFPMLHLLREDSIEQAISRYGDVEEIPERNIETMHRLGIDTLRRILQGGQV